VAVAFSEGAQGVALRIICNLERALASGLLRFQPQIHFFSTLFNAVVKAHFNGALAFLATIYCEKHTFLPLGEVV
jgi:hypothetical protein